MRAASAAKRCSNKACSYVRQAEAYGMKAVVPAEIRRQAKLPKPRAGRKRTNARAS